MAKILIISHDLISPRMAGVGIRYYEIAGSLAAGFTVMLAAPTPSTLPAEQDRFALREFDWNNPAGLNQALAENEIIFAAPDTIWLLRHQLTESHVVVIDAYDPTLLEHLEMDQRLPMENRLSWHADYQRMMDFVYHRGDLFLCGTQRQRLWWMGALERAGRLNPLTYAADPSLKSLVDILPYGIPAVPPTHSFRVMRNVLPGLSEEDKVVLWGGGAWDWLDPLCAVDAIERIVRRQDNVKLVFPGLNHPHPNRVPAMPIATRVLDRVRDSGLLNRNVFIGDWADYSAWQNYLLESDIAISLHRDHIEASMSSRTRILSYVWGSLPMVLTRGDELADRMHDAGVALLVPAGDADAVADAILNLLSVDKKTLEPIFYGLHEALGWGRCTASLLTHCARPKRAADVIHRPCTAEETAAHPETDPPLELMELSPLSMPQLERQSFWKAFSRRPLGHIFTRMLESIRQQQDKINQQIAAHVYSLQRMQKQALQALQQNQATHKKILEHLSLVAEQGTRHEQALQALPALQQNQAAHEKILDYLRAFSEQGTRHIQALQMAYDRLAPQAADAARDLQHLKQLLADVEKAQTTIAVAIARSSNIPEN